MPPKATPDNDNSAAIIALCQMMMSATEFKPDNAKLAPILGIAQSKNVPRKINTYINPHGFEYKSGAIIKLAENVVPVTPTITKTPAMRAKSTDASLTKKSAKKRKLEDDEEDDVAAGDGGAEATIKGEDAGEKVVAGGVAGSEEDA